MPPGIFVTSADTIELYVLDGDWTFNNSGFTALAHPSPIEIGTTHGVFVLDDSSVKSLLQVSICFHLKPSIQVCEQDSLMKF